MRKLWIAAALLAASIGSAYADTGLASRCDGIMAPTQAAACTGSRSFVHPVAGDYVLSYPSIPADSTAVSWSDANLQFREWSTIAANPAEGVEVCTKNLMGSALTIPVGGTDQCAPGADAAAKVFVAAPTVTPGGTPPPPAVVTKAKTFSWTAVTGFDDGSTIPATASSPVTYNLYLDGVLLNSAPITGTAYAAPIAIGNHAATATAVFGGVEGAQDSPVSFVVSSSTTPGTVQGLTVK